MHYGLEEVGARIWELIAEPRTVGEICDTLLDEYESSRTPVNAT
jgi:hypothetical protein